MATIDGWRGQTIVGVRSRTSQKFWARDWRDFVLDPIGAIVRKSGAAPGASGWFADDDRACVTEVDGKCSYLQSLQSEDTVTWTAFNPRHVPDAALTAMLEIAFGPSPERPPSWSRRFWQRFPHPETQRQSEGPEPDLVLDAPGWRYVVEAKWLADLDDGQGVEGKTNQLAMRLAVARSEVTAVAKRGVLVIVPSPGQYAGHGTFAKYFVTDGETYRPLPLAIENEARAITWDQVIAVIEREVGAQAEVVQYLRWRLANIR